MFKSVLLLSAFVMVVVADPNEEYAACCKEKSVPETCVKYCTYDNTPSTSEVFRANPKSFEDECKTDDVISKLLQCQQKGKDNRACCEAAGVGKDFEYCLDLCDGTKPLIPDVKYENCVTDDDRNEVKECGKDS